jgi:hypothetical protein
MYHFVQFDGLSVVKLGILPVVCCLASELVSEFNALLVLLIPVRRLLDTLIHQVLVREAERLRQLLEVAFLQLELLFVCLFIRIADCFEFAKDISKLRADVLLSKSILTILYFPQERCRLLWTHQHRIWTIIGSINLE